MHEQPPQGEPAQPSPPLSDIESTSPEALIRATLRAFAGDLPDAPHHGVTITRNNHASTETKQEPPFEGSC